MSEQRAVYVLNNEDDGGDTEELKTVVRIEQSNEKPIGKGENMNNQLCEYLADHLAWVKALSNDQAATLFYALLKQKPDAVKIVIERAEAEEEARKAQESHETQKLDG